MDSTAILRVLKNIRIVGSIFQQFFHTGEGGGMEVGFTFFFFYVLFKISMEWYHERAVT